MYLYGFRCARHPYILSLTVHPMEQSSIYVGTRPATPHTMSGQTDVIDVSSTVIETNETR